MSDSHKHRHDHSAYYMEQLCTMGACGALGLVVVLLYFQKTLDNQRVLSLLLANYLHPFLVGSGIAILAIVGLRGTFLIMSARRRSGKDSDIDHHESCSHQHDNNRWSPMRYVVLCLPVILFLLGLPNEGFRSAKAVEIEEPDKAIAEKHGDVIHLDFMEFYDSAHNEAKREYLQGRTGVLKGQLTMAWVQVTGQIQYGKRKGRDQYIPVLKPGSSKDIVSTSSEDPYYID